MVLNENSDKKAAIVVFEKDQLLFMKKNGINRSSFVRQAVRAYQNGDWHYNYLED